MVEAHKLSLLEDNAIWIGLNEEVLSPGMPDKRSYALNEVSHLTLLIMGILMTPENAIHKKK